MIIVKVWYKWINLIEAAKWERKYICCTWEKKLGIIKIIVYGISWKFWYWSNWELESKVKKL
jgi:hypothetical protein